MIKTLLTVTVITLALSSCKNISSSSQNTKMNTDTATNVSFNKMLEQYYEDHLKFFPLEATAIGDDRYDDRLYADFTESYHAKLKAFFQQYLDSLQQYNRDQLEENDQISYDILKYELTTDIEGLQFHNNYFPFDQFNGIHIEMGKMGTGTGNQPFNTVKNYENWLKRVKAFDMYADSAIEYFRKGMATGEVLPKTIVEKVIPECRGMEVSDPTKSLFYGPIEKFPADFSDSTKARLTAAYKAAIMNDLVPSYKKLGDFLQKEYLPKARTTSGINALPDGEAMYAYDVKYWTTTDLTPDSIYNLGLQQVAMLKSEMEKVKDSVGFKGDLKSFFHYLRTDPKFTPFKTDSDVIHAYFALLGTVNPQMPKYFHHFPKTKFMIKETEKFRAASASAEYSPGTADGSRPGVFYVPIVDATKFNVTDGMNSTFLHEAIPGHHYQVSLQQENTLLPRFRRYSWYGAYGEGWAHYAETLGYELGVYKDPYQHFGALNDQMLRAIRLVVDVGLHTGRMTREQAIQYMMDNQSTSEEDATSAIERYMVYPGQALSYKVGSVTIKALREKYEQQLGNRFDIAAFHDEFLKDGCMPLSVLERKMDVWAKRQMGS